MAKLIRVYDPTETERKINLNIPEDVCPGLLEFMSELPYGKDTPLIRGVFYQWFLLHSEAGTLDEALNQALSGPGGMIATGRQSRREISAPPARKKRVPKQREVTAKPGAGRAQSVTGHTDSPAPALPLSQPSNVVENRSAPGNVADYHPPQPMSVQLAQQTDLSAQDQAEPVHPGSTPGGRNGAEGSGNDHQAAQPGSTVSEVADDPTTNPAAVQPEPTPEQMAVLNSMGTMFGS